MKSIKPGLILTAFSLLIQSASFCPLWAMDMYEREDEVGDKSHTRISSQNMNDIAGISAGMQSMSFQAPSAPSAIQILPLEENKQAQPLSRKKQLKGKALQGDKEAQCKLGMMFRDGDDVFKDPSKAVKWFDLSAKQGHFDAMNALSQMYLEGTDIDQDYKLALKWVKKLIEHGNSEGQYRAGNMYKNGWGVKKDEAEAIKWYQKSADQGYEPARKALGLDKSKEELKENKKKIIITKTEEIQPYISNVSSIVKSPVVSDILIPEIANGYEEIYRRFINGKLIYKPDPNSDKGRIELPIAALSNPLEGTFDLSKCGDSGKYLSISTGYRKGKKAENKDKLEVWIAPRFLIERNLSTTASHFKPIMDNWKAACQVALFYTSGGADTLDYYDYLTTQTLDQLSSNNLYKKWTAAPPCTQQKDTNSKPPNSTKYWDKHTLRRISHYIFELK